VGHPSLGLFKAFLTMTISPKKHEDDRRAESNNAVDVARANLSYDPPTNRPWRKIASWATLLLFAVAVALLAGHFGRLTIK
jgi:hypothetical protein